jgi:hypothetical protein
MQPLNRWEKFVTLANETALILGRAGDVGRSREAKSLAWSLEAFTTAGDRIHQMQLLKELVRCAELKAS